MTPENTAPYGSFVSPIDAELIAAAAISLRDPVIDGDDVYWLEGRPSEGGRYVLVASDAGRPDADVTPAGFNVRTTVHEYGGGSYLVHDGTVYFSNFADQRVYRQASAANPSRSRPEAPSPLRRLHLRLAAQPHHLRPRGSHDRRAARVINTVVADRRHEWRAGRRTRLRATTSTPIAAPQPGRLAPGWLTWNHPNMPWDGTELWVRELDADGSLGAATLVAGGVEESIFQPEWSPDGALYFVSDRSGWWNLYRWRERRSRAA